MFPLEDSGPQRKDGALFDEERHDGTRTVLTRDPQRPLALPPPAASQLPDFLRRIGQLNASLQTDQPFDRLLDAVVALALDSTHADQALLFLREAQTFHLRAARTREAEPEADPTYSATILREAVERNRVVLCHDAAEDPRFCTASSVVQRRMRSVLCVPLQDAKGVLGALYLDNARYRRMFGPTDVYLAESLADHAVVAVRMAQLVEDNKHLLRRQASTLVEQRREILRLQNGPQAGEADPQPVHPYRAIVGRSLPMRRLLVQIDRVLESDVSVLILGESGTGKDLVARAVHEHGRRAGGPFVAVNCGAISPGLFEAEFFGHVRGSFTGSIRDRRGHLAAAHGGTLFLDEVCELNHEQQVKLLRALQDQQVLPVGSSSPRRVDVRILSATNRDVAQLLREQKLRNDLYYRIGAMVLHVPPLRERCEDIAALVQHFLGRLTSASGHSVRVSTKVLRMLMSYDWPGNVRELENVVANLSLCADEAGWIQAAPRMAPAELAEGGPEPLLIPLGTTLTEAERLMLLKTLAWSGWNRSRAAAVLGIDRSTLYRRMKALNIPQVEGDHRDDE